MYDEILMCLEGFIMANTALSRRKKQSSLLGFVVIAVVVFLITFVIFLQGREVKGRLDAYTAQEETIDAQIAKEKERTEEIEEFEKYVQTKAYAGEQAQEKLGLVKEGEIVFRKE